MIFKNYKKLFWLSIFIMAFVVVTFSEAYALRVIPQRLVLKPGVKVEHMFVKNNSNKTETFRFGWKHMAMDKEGNVLNLDKIGMENAPAGYKPVDDLIRFSPRRTVLQPGQTQRITFMVKHSKALETGEYRSHFLFERVPNKVEDQELDPNSLENDEVSKPHVKFEVLVSRAVPIYMLNGDTNAKISLISASVDKNANKNHKDQPDYIANFKVQKVGNRSVIGIAQVLCNSAGEEVVISKPSRVFAVYAEGEFRNEKLGVKIPPKGCSSYRLIVKGHSDDLMAGKTLIDQTF